MLENRMEYMRTDGGIDMNAIEVCGRLQGELRFIHKVRNGEEMYTGEIVSTRLSGAQDRIPFTVSGQMLAQVNELLGKTARLRGQLRSYHYRENGKCRLRVTLYVLEAEESLESTMNQVDLTGKISMKPQYRVTPFGKEVCDIMLSVQRTRRKNCFIPCIAWGTNAKLLSLCNIGDRLSICGRIQSREYTKVLDSGEKIRRMVQEVSIFKVDVDEESASDMGMATSM